jgi:hypothetical protein
MVTEEEIDDLQIIENRAMRLTDLKERFTNKCRMDAELIAND